MFFLNQLFFKIKLLNAYLPSKDFKYWIKENLQNLETKNN